MTTMSLYTFRLRWFLNRQLRKLNFDRRVRGYRIAFEGNRFRSVGFVFLVQNPKGAGCIGGWTAYLALNSGKREWEINHRGRHSFFPVELGLTRNFNRVPYVSH